MQCEYRDYYAEINERCSKLPLPLQREAIRRAVLSAAMAARAADDEYTRAMEIRKLTSEVVAVQDLYDESVKQRQRFDELLNATMAVSAATEAAFRQQDSTGSVSGDSNYEWIVGAVPPPTAPERIEHPSDEISDAPRRAPESPYSFALRDVVTVNLDMRVIGKITARGPRIAVCELLEGCWVYNRFTSKVKLIPAGHRILAVGADLVCPHYSGIGYICESGEGIVGRCTPAAQKLKQNGLGPCVTASNDVVLPGFLAYMAANVWHRSNSIDVWEIGLPATTCAIDGTSTHKSNPSPHLVHYTRVGFAPPKVRILHYENSYRALVAAPWDFNIDALRARAAQGENVNLRDEVEGTLIGTESPIYRCGRGVEFKYILESQISPLLL